MKHFLILITYKVDLAIIDSLLGQHRAFLQTGYDKNLLLMSGPENPRSGGIVIAKANSLEEIKNFFQNDPYYKNNAAGYEYREFNPVKFQPVLTDWIAGE
ncbi:MAG: YciI family protein [Ignavibacteriaceae bacterium]|jgi:uncharacterized protein YciI